MKKLFTVLSFGFALFFFAKDDALYAQLLPVPLAHWSQAGTTFAPQIQNVQVLWQNKEFANMSKAVDALHGAFVLAIGTSDTGATKEVVVLREWFFYFLAALPMLPEEKIFYSDFYRAEEKSFRHCVMQKAGGCYDICNATRSRIAEVLQVSEAAVAQRHAVYLAAYLNFFLRIQTLAERGNLKQEKRTDTPQLIADDKFLYSGRNADANRKVAREQIALRAKGSYDIYRKGYISVLVSAAPSNSTAANVIQAGLSKIGISSKVKMAIALEEAIGRSNVNRHFFVGLPTQLQIQQYLDKESRTNFIQKTKETFSTEPREVRALLKKNYDKALQQLSNEKVTAMQAAEIWDNFCAKLHEARTGAKKETP
jgi:hypothetical protein